jgi:transposase
MKLEYYDYLKFAEDALEFAKSVPKYFSKFSNRIYCNHQKLAIYVLMQKFKTTTRGIVSILRTNSDLRLYLGLSRVPVHSTIVRFVKKIRTKINSVLGIKQAHTVAVDATGFELESKSYYYRNKFECYTRRKTKKFMKLNATVDIDTQCILTYKMHKSCKHDSQSFIGLLKKLKVDYVLADKGYSSKKLRHFVVRHLKAIPIIPKKRNEGKFFIKQGKILHFDEEKYPKRNIVENVFFCIKQKYGSVLRNKSCATQKVELISKMIAHNVDRMQHLRLLIFQRVAPTPVLSIGAFLRILNKRHL